MHWSKVSPCFDTTLCNGPCSWDNFLPSAISSKKIQSISPSYCMQEDGWVVCRVFEKKFFFKTTSGRSDGNSNRATIDTAHTTTTATTHDQSRPELYLPNFHPHLPPQTSTFYKPEISLHQYSHQLPPTNPYSGVQLQDLLPNPRPSTGYDFDGLGVVGVNGGCEQIHQDVEGGSNWGPVDSKGGQMDLWGYGK